MSGSTLHAHGDETRHGLRVLLLGATGTAGRATAHALVHAGHNVTCLVRKGSMQQRVLNLPAGVQILSADVTDPDSVQRDAFGGKQFDALVSCLASRNGSPGDAWAIDYQAHVNVLAATKRAGIGHMVLLSAICVQRPRLIFQQAKLAFEKQLMDSGLTYSIVRPTAFFKSLSGQVERVKNGKPFLLFGNGTLTACKPISDHDLGEYIAACVTLPERRNKILPIGGPGKAITPREQGEQLFAMTGQKPRFIKIPLALINSIRLVLETGGKLSRKLADKAEFARIAHYYATESMLVLDPETGKYNADATPSTGTQTLFDYYGELLDGTCVVERGEHAVFRD